MNSKMVDRNSNTSITMLNINGNTQKTKIIKLGFLVFFKPTCLKGL